MNFSSLSGFIAAFSIFLITMLNSLKDPKALLNTHALIFVVGGTIAASLIAFPFKKLLTLAVRVFKLMILRQKQNPEALIPDIVALSRANRANPKAFESMVQNIEYGFLRDAARVLFWIRAEVAPEELRRTLEMRAATIYKESIAEANMAKILAKFPPALGLMGTTVGMIELLQGLGSSGDPKAFLGKAMSVALMATLYGLATSNFLLIPIGESLTKQAKESQKLYAMIIESVMLIQANKPSKYVEEHAKSFLLPEERRVLDESVVSESVSL